MALPLPEDRPTNAELLTLLAEGELEVVTRVLDSSNAAYILRVARGGDCVWAVYKPQSGERPLWDFARGLHARERAAFLLSEALGWGLVPPTIVRRDGPSGVGSLQYYIENDVATHYFTMYRADAATHDSLRALALFDLVANNADRKSGHVLLGVDGRVWGIDHGLCFASEYKLRTVIWEWGGEPIPAEIIDDVDAFVRAGLPDPLAELLDPFERDALLTRRVYKPPMPHAQARAIILAERGRRFDPDVVDSFLACGDEFRAIADRYRDSDEALKANLATVLVKTTD